MGIGDGDDIMGAERQMQSRLVSQMLDPRDDTFLALALRDLFRTQADIGSAVRSMTEQVGRQQVDAG